MVAYNILALVYQLVNLYTILIFVRCIMTWLPRNTGVMQSIDSVLGKICDPYLNLFKRFIPPIGGAVDISPIFALLALQLIVRVIVWVVNLFL